MQDRFKKRDPYWDYIKGIGILLVLAGHLFPWGSPVRKIIYGFHMPLFFFVSGVFISGMMARPFTGALKRIWNSTVVPFVFFVILSVLFFAVKVGVGISSRVTIKSALLSFYVGHPFLNGPLWFLVALGCGLFITWLIVRIRDQFHEQNLVVLVAVAVLYGLFISVGFVQVIRCKFPLVMTSWPCVCLMLLFGCYHGLGFQRSIEKMNKWAAVILAILLFCTEALLALTHHQFGIRSTGSPVFLFTSVLGIIGVMLLAQLLVGLRNGRMSKVVEFLGVNSLFIFSIETAFVRPMVLKGLSLIDSRVSASPFDHTNPIGWTVVSFVFVCVICSLFVRPLSRLYALWKNVVGAR